jgi:hypothetical protein
MLQKGGQLVTTGAIAGEYDGVDQLGLLDPLKVGKYSYAPPLLESMDS